MKITPNLASAPSLAPSVGPPARNVVSCLAKSRARMMIDPATRARSPLSSSPSATWPCEDAREQRRRVLPDVEARVVGDQLEAGHRQRVADAVAEPQPVEHVLDARLDVDEQVEPALLDRQLAAERVADARSRRPWPGRSGSLPKDSMSSTSIVRWNLKATDPSRSGWAPRAKSVSPNVTCPSISSVKRTLEVMRPPPPRRVGRVR